MRTHNHSPQPVNPPSVQTEGGYGTPQYVPRAIPPNLGIRNPESLQTPDVESQPVKLIALALVHLRQEISKIAVMTEDRSRPVDEYQPQEIVGEAESTLNVQPQWETNERITSVLVTGPPGAITVQLGDRIWPLIIPASGVLVIAPVSLFLGRGDVRQLTSATPGQYSLELMGYADSRGQLI